MTVAECIRVERERGQWRQLVHDVVPWTGNQSNQQPQSALRRTVTLSQYTVVQ